MPFIPFVEEDLQSCSTSTAPQTTLPESNPDYEYESDIVDQCGSMIDRLEHQDIPQRPSSRLGFHSPPSNNYIADLEDPNEDLLETVNWTHMAPNGETVHSRTATAYDFDEDITTVASADALKFHEPPFLSMPPTSINISDTSRINIANPFSLSDDDESDGSDPDSDCSSCENSDEDFDFSLTSVSLPSRSSSSTSTFMAPVAHFSMSSTHSPRPLSPTEPKPITPVRLPHLKPNYNNHGYSRHALLHLKWFWAGREGKWAEDDDQICDSKAYGPGQSSQSSAFGPLPSSTQRNLVQRLKLKTPPRHSTLPPMSVHPRRGDIAALRDPYSMHMDRCFVNMPSWTLAKTMYMFDVHVGYEWHSRLTASKWKRCDDNVGISQGAEIHKRSSTEARRRKEASTDTVDDVDLDSESESLGTSASIASSDDSDATLVESENEGDIEREGFSTFGALMSGAGPSSLLSSSFVTPRFENVSPTACPTEKSSSKSPLSLSLYAQMASRSAELLSSLNDDTKSRKPWATNWYHRWEILLDLMRSNWNHHQFFAALGINERPHCAEQLSYSTNGDAEVAGRKGKRRLKRQPRFYFEDENSSEDSNSWEWDSSFDWKNMAQISGPGFGVGVQSLDGSVLL